MQGRFSKSVEGLAALLFFKDEL